MKLITIPTVGHLIGYEWDDLSAEAKERAVLDSVEFEIEVMDTQSPYYYLAEEMERMSTPWFLGEALYEKHKDDLIETLKINDYLFDIEGDIIPLLHYVGNDGQTEKIEYKSKYHCTISDI